MSLYHLVQTDLWDKTQSSGAAYYPPTYSQDGFIHLTADPALLLEVANRFYTDSQGDWEVLVIDPTKLTSEVKYESPAPVGDKPAGDLGAKDEVKFPHLYGTIDYESVERRLPVKRDAAGKFLEVVYS